MEENIIWSEWQKFPDPRKGEYLYAPFGSGIYQLKSIIESQYILFGCGKNIAQRMTSLLPQPYGTGTRYNKLKREYVIQNIEKIQYRTTAIMDPTEMKNIERKLKSRRNHLFNT